MILTNKYTVWNIHSIDRTLFSHDLDLSPTLLLTDLYKSPASLTTFQNNFEKLILAITDVIEKYAPFQTTSRKQKQKLHKP